MGSTNSAATAAAVAAAGWASWAVGAVTAKFYKSPAGTMPGTAGGSQEVCKEEVIEALINFGISGHTST